MSAQDSGLPDALKLLALEFDHDRPRVVVVVGAGVSSGATGLKQASWKGLLAHGLEFLYTIGRIPEGHRNTMLETLEGMFEPFDREKVLERAELVRLQLRGGDTDKYPAWLDHAFRPLQADPILSATLDALRELQRAGALLLTTNYDDLLSKATDLPPVTRLDREDFLRAITRPSKDSGAILHIHGHWQKADSVVLGLRSYEDILKDEAFQAAFQALWLNNHWLFVGCGNGLDDPNLGRLLSWGQHWWSDSALPHWLLAIEDQANTLRQRPDLPQNLEIVGYRDHDEHLPAILHALTPHGRCTPFAHIDAGFGPIRSAHSSHVDNHFPSWQEFLDEEVPALRADARVSLYLREQRWACVLDVASVGKTTLALRMAAAAKRRGDAAYYLDLATTDPAATFDPRPINALRRLVGRNTLLIVDNAQHASVLAHALWSEWRARPCGSCLLLIATESKHDVTVHAAQDLAHIIRDPDHPVIAVRPQPKDLVRILHAIFRRFGMPPADFPAPPAGVVTRWFRDYGQALGAFCFAVLDRYAQLLEGDWALPLSAAADWVWDRWLEKMGAEDRANALCLAAFGAQELELTVPKSALPFPDEVKKLCAIGLAVESLHGPYLQYRRYGLREPGWGQLLLTAFLAHERMEQDVAEFNRLLLIEAVARSLDVAIMLAIRWRQDDGVADAQWTQDEDRLWQLLESSLDPLVEAAFSTDIETTVALLESAHQHGRTSISGALWKRFESSPEIVRAVALNSPLSFTVHLLAIAHQHDRTKIRDALWDQFESSAERMRAVAFEAPPNFTAHVLAIAHHHGRTEIRDALWDLFESSTLRMHEVAFGIPLNFTAHVLMIAHQHMRKSCPKQILRSFESSLETVVGAVLAEKNAGVIASLLASILRQEGGPDVDDKQLPLHWANYPALTQSLVYRILGHIQVGHWAERAQRGAFFRPATLAVHCHRVGQHRHAEAILTASIGRANANDFPPQISGLSEAALLLRCVNGSEVAGLDKWIDAVCTPRWLGWQYENAKIGTLASGLRLLALYQPVGVVHRFRNIGLRLRIEKEFGGFRAAEAEHASQCMQLLGSVSLCGFTIPVSLLANIGDCQLIALPDTVLPHRPEATHVEEWQYQLWLGLRTVVALQKRPLRFAPGLVRQTRDLWRLNLQRSGAAPLGAEHRVDQQMVAWLDTCLSRGEGGLIPPDRSFLLPELVGFKPG